MPCNPLTALNRTGEFCLRNSSCISGLCLSHPPRCADASKSCPNNCGGSSSGICTYKSVDGSALSSCSVSNPFCQAMCSCLPNHFGRDCSLSSSSLRQYQALRASICAALVRNLDKQSVSADVVASRAFTVGNIFSDVSQISASALLNCTYVLTYTVKNNINLLCHGNTPTIVLQALSNVAQLGSRLRSSLFTDISNAVNILLSSCHNSMATGQVPQATYTANIRALSYVADQNSGSIGCNGVQSELEAFLQVPPTAMCPNLT